MSRLDHSPSYFQINFIQDALHRNIDHDNEPISSSTYTELFFYCLEFTLKEKYVPFKCDGERLSFQSEDGLEIWNIQNAEDGNLQVSCFERNIINYISLYEDDKLLSPATISSRIYCLTKLGKILEDKDTLFEMCWKNSFDLTRDLKFKQLDIDHKRYKHVSADGIVLKNELKNKNIKVYR